MRRSWIVVAVLGLVGLCSPLAAASPFGSFGGIVTGGNSGAGVIPLHGWALDDDGVAAVDVVVDGRVAGRALYGTSRPGVTQSFPGFPDSQAPGWAFQLDSTRYLNGLHTITARVLSETGEVTTLNSRQISFGNLTHNLVPFGAIEFPNNDAQLWGRCDDLTNPNRRYAVVQGYALDVGVERNDQGVGYLELMIDGVVHRNTFTSCHFDSTKGGLSDCYGLTRIDIRQLFPHVVSDPPLVGFRFVLDVGELIGSGFLAPGRHRITIRGGDVAGQVSNLAEINAFFSCDDFIGNVVSFGEIRRPRAGLTYQGTIEVDGWALDLEGVHAVIPYVDGHRLLDAEYGLPRPFISSIFPGYPNSALPGWRFLLDTAELSDGQHTIQVFVRDLFGEEHLIGERVIQVFNP